MSNPRQWKDKDIDFSQNFEIPPFPVKAIKRCGRRAREAVNGFFADTGVFEIGHCSLGRDLGHGNSWTQMVGKASEDLGIWVLKDSRAAAVGWELEPPQVAPPVSLTKCLPLLSLRPSLYPLPGAGEHGRRMGEKDHLLKGLGRWASSLEAFQDSGWTARKSRVCPVSSGS